MSTEMYGTSRIAIRDGKLYEFTRLMKECVQIVRTQDPGTSQYDIFITADGTECFVHERFATSEDGLAHMRNIGPMMERLSEVCTMTGEVCGSPSAELRAALESAGVTIYEPLASATH